MIKNTKFSEMRSEDNLLMIWIGPRKKPTLYAWLTIENCEGLTLYFETEFPIVSSITALYDFQNANNNSEN